MYIYVYTNIYIYTYVYEFAYSYTYVYTCIHIYIYIYTFIYIHTLMYVHTNSCAYLYVYRYTTYVRMHIHSGVLMQRISAAGEHDSSSHDSCPVVPLRSIIVSFPWEEFSKREATLSLYIYVYICIYLFIYIKSGGSAVCDLF